MAYVPAILSGLLLSVSQLAMAVTVGETLPSVTLGGKHGGRVDGQPWSSQELKGKIHVMFYVDPDKKDANPDLEKALAAADFPEDKVSSVAVINMAATWLPNFAIAKSLEDKQKKYPDTTYVKDLDKVLVNKWRVPDDDYVVLAVDDQGKVFFEATGKLTEDRIEELIKAVQSKL